MKIEYIDVWLESKLKNESVISNTSNRSNNNSSSANSSSSNISVQINDRRLALMYMGLQKMSTAD